MWRGLFRSKQRNWHDIWCTTPQIALVARTFGQRLLAPISVLSVLLTEA